MTTKNTNNPTLKETLACLYRRASLIAMIAVDNAAKKPSPGGSPQPGRVQGLEMMLEIMKLAAPNDPQVFRSLKAWTDVEPWKSHATPQSVPPEKADLCRTLSTMLLMRLLRAFEKRADPNITQQSEPDDTSRQQKQQQQLAENGGSGPSSAHAQVLPGFAPAVTVAPTVPPVAKKFPSVADMMKRSVKVTRVVREAIEFVGSDMLRLLQVIPAATTLADVTACCLKMLSVSDDRLKTFYRVFTDSNMAIKEQPHDVVDPSEPTKFGVFALQSLQEMQLQVISRYETAYDHDCIFETAYSNIPSFKSSIEAIHGTGPLLPDSAPATAAVTPDTEARNVSWKIARFLALKQDFSSEIGDEDDRRTKMWHRRKHIVDCASAIAFSVELGQLNQVIKGTFSDTQGPRDQSDEIAHATAPLMAFLASNTDKKGQALAPVTREEIRASLTKVRKLMMSLPCIPKNSPWFQFGPTVPFWGLPLEVQRYIMENYIKLLSEMISKVQTEILYSSTPESARPSRTPLSRCLFLFPMVVGEQWGIHRDSPILTSKHFCTGTSTRVSLASKDSVALVMKVKPSRAPTSSKKRQPSSQPSGSEPPAKRMQQQSSLQRESSTQRLQQQTAKRTESLPKRSDPTTKPMGQSTKPSTQNTLCISKQPQAKPRPPKIVKMSDVDPPVVNDAMELNEWTLSVLSLSVIKPSDSLLTLLGEHDRRRGDSMTCLHELIIPVLNRGISRVSKSLQMAQLPVAPNAAGQIFVGKRDGRVYVNGSVNEDIQLCASVVGFFYHSLEAIMNDQLKRLEFLGPFNALMQSESFHRALLAICYACVLKGVGATQRLQIDASYKDCTVFILLETIECNPYTFLKVTEALRRALVATDDESRRISGSPLIPRLPTILHQYVQKIEVQLLESVVWAQTMPSTKSEPTLMITVKSMQSLPGSWPPDVLAPILPEELIDVSSEPAKISEIRFKPTFSASSEANFLTYILRKLLKIGMHRIQKIFAALDMSNETLLHTQTYVAFRFCLRNHIDMLYERHIDQILLCTIYGICKVMNVKSVGSQHSITFGQIIDAYCDERAADQGQRTCRVIVRHVKLASSDDEVRPRGDFFGSVIDFYNQVYVPKIHRHFLRSKSLRQSIAEYNRLKERHEVLCQTSALGHATALSAQTLSTSAQSKTGTMATTTVDPSAGGENTVRVAAGIQVTTGDATEGSAPG